MSTATLSDDRPVDPDDELLVAYLDGELDRQSRSSLEQRLLEEEKLRGRLQELQRGWDLLDELPQATPSEKLVESTLELVVADMVTEPAHRDSIWSRFRFPLSIAAASLLAILVAVGGVWQLREYRYQQQLRDLALAENYDAYAKGHDLELMDQLHRNAEWKKTIDQASEVGRIQPRTTAMVADTPVHERAELIEELPVDQRQSLAARWNRFVNTPQPQREQLRETAAAVDAQIHSEELLETMRQYAVWRETLPPEWVDQIESQDPETRAAGIEQAIALTQQRIVGRSRSLLSQEAVLSIYEALEDIMLERIDRLDPQDETSEVAQLRERVTTGRGASFRLGLYLGLFGGPRSPGPPGPDAPDGADRSDRENATGGADSDRDEPEDADEPGDPAGGYQQLRRPLSDAELDWVEFALPPRARENLDSISMLSPFTRELTLRAWAEEAISRRLPGRSHQEATVLQRYKALGPEEQKFLDLVPADQWGERLARPRHRRGPPPR